MIPRYLDVEDWEILDRRTIHAYNEDETPIEVLKVQIGTYQSYSTVLDFNTRGPEQPIIRWLPKSEYTRLLNAGGPVLW